VPNCSFEIGIENCATVSQATSFELHHCRPVDLFNVLPYILTKQSLSDFGHIDTEEEGATRKEK